MNRRDMLKRFGAVPLAVAGLSAVKSIAGKEIQPADVLRDSFEVHGYQDANGAPVYDFAFTMLRGPWPEAGQTVHLRHGETKLVGRVEQVTLTPAYANVFRCDVRGKASAFNLPGVPA